MGNDKTLGDYLERKYFNPIKEEPKLTFEEWWEKSKAEYPSWFQVNTAPAKAIWKAAQENK